MRKSLHAFLVASSILVQLLVATPAGAGMVETPRPRPEEREAALQGATLRTPGDVESLRSMPTAELLLLANAPESFLHASNDALIALLIVALVLLFVATIVVIVIISRVQRHHRHLHGEREGEPVPSPAGRASR